MKIDKQKAIKIYNDSPSWFQKELETEFGVNFYKEFDYRNIKSFEDACKKLGIDSSLLPDVSMISNDLQKSIIANYQLCVIYKAINNGWIPDFTNPNEYKYYPWFKFLSSGLDYSYTNCNCGDSFTGVGVRLCTDTSAKAEYIGKQFKDLFEDYLL